MSPPERAVPIDFLRGVPVPGNLDVRWIHGSPSPRHPTDPPLQVHGYDAHTFILRESKDISFKAPFLFLLTGNDRALLLDTGATSDPRRFPVRGTVDRVLRDWLGQHPREEYELVVAHTHPHGDHVAGDSQFLDRPKTRVIGKDLDALRTFFGFVRWPDEVVRFDLGGRVLEVFGIPGHHPASLAVYDPWTGWLFTGDTVYPGRLYVRDMNAFLASLKRLVEFAASRRVTQVMGCHVEMTRSAGRDYPIGTRYQPDEPPLPMSVGQLVAVREASVSVADRPGPHAFEDFLIFNGPCTAAVLWQRLRALGLNLRHQLV